MIIKYIDNDFIIQERLIGIGCTENIDAETLFQILLHSFTVVGLTTDNFIGQCYEGASNMCEHIAGVQAKVKAIQPNAIYTHCYAYYLNFVLVEATSSNRYSKNVLACYKICITSLKEVHTDMPSFKQ